MKEPQQSRRAVAETSADINRQYREFSGQRDAITKELAAMCAARLRGKTPEPAPMSEADRRARAYAKELLNGNSPTNWTSPPDTSRAQELLVKRCGLDPVLDVLRNSEIALRAAEAT